jgi:hypothetical protein
LFPLPQPLQKTVAEMEHDLSPPKKKRVGTNTQNIPRKRYVFYVVPTLASRIHRREDGHPFDDDKTVPGPVTALVMCAVPARAVCSGRMHTATAAPHDRFGQVRIISTFPAFRCAIL